MLVFLLLSMNFQVIPSTLQFIYAMYHCLLDTSLNNDLIFFCHRFQVTEEVLPAENKVDDTDLVSTPLTFYIGACCCLP